MSSHMGCRGYVSSRPVRGMAYPQRVQNLVIRDYAQRKKLNYLLSSTEFAMPGCYMMLEDILGELSALNGVILFSVFMLPQNKERRMKVYEKILANDCALYAALEDMSLESNTDVDDFEDVIQVVNALPQVPLNDAYHSFRLKMDQQDPFVSAFNQAL